ncbi:hypothetical protein [Borrelia sp. RT5S]|uniref:hypothetical protein n=1 Tax=Borrelia sp. RT5S TaxID=2898581 RepID=UPI001E3DCB35|nr:hypothetical protein [Borrelia sp. RT5S]UGQ16638.1 hypothetical protein LSO06_04805 [Borrelia sp. RT5S]
MGNLVERISKLFFSSKEEDRGTDNFCMPLDKEKEVSVVKKKKERPPLNLTDEERELMTHKVALKNKEEDEAIQRAA